MEDNPEAKRVIELINQGRSVVINGSAGTGKSYLARIIIQGLEKANYNVAVCAPTGTAAANVGGVTIHSLFSFKIFGELSTPKSKLDVLKTLDALIIDEFSMIRSDLFHAMNQSMQIAKGNDLPFGGVAVIMFGDLNQLSPVVVRDLDELNRMHGGIYFFNSTAYSTLGSEVVKLKKNYRQNEAEYIMALGVIQEGAYTPLAASVFDKRVAKSREDSLYICATNKQVDERNATKLRLNPNPTFKFDAVYTGDFNKSDSPYIDKLVLKEGANVVMLNNDSSSRWCNGSQGIITALSENNVLVKFKNGEYPIEKITIENPAYKVVNGKSVLTVIGTMLQYPMKLGYAITVHKSQGQTYEDVHVELGNYPVHGLVYTALSRCKSLAGLTLSRKITHRDVFKDPTVKKFLL